jgi:hypothetical protein
MVAIHRGLRFSKIGLMRWVPSDNDGGGGGADAEAAANGGGGEAGEGPARQRRRLMGPSGGGGGGGLQFGGGSSMEYDDEEEEDDEGEMELGVGYHHHQQQQQQEGQQQLDWRQQKLELQRQRVAGLVQQGVPLSQFGERAFAPGDDPWGRGGMWLMVSSAGWWVLLHVACIKCLECQPLPAGPTGRLLTFAQPPGHPAPTTPDPLIPLSTPPPCAR